MQNAGEFTFNQAVSGSADANITYTTPLKIDSSGRVLQGKDATKGSTGETVPTFCNEIASDNPNVFEIANNGTNSANSYSVLALSRSDSTSVNGHTAVDSGDQIGEVCFIGADGSDRFNTAAAIKTFANSDFSANNCPAYLSFFTNGGSASATERMRISSDNEVLFGITATPSTTQNGIRIHTKPSLLPAFVVSSSASYTSDYDHFVFKNANGTVGSIRTSGGATSYRTSSDYRLKENETAITDGITRLKQLKPYKFNFKSDPSTVLDGFFAHEVSSVVPNAVSGDKDCVATEQNVKRGLAENVGDIIPQRLDHSKLVPLLTAALQEAISEIETLKTEVAALKSQLNN